MAVCAGWGVDRGVGGVLQLRAQGEGRDHGDLEEPHIEQQASGQRGSMVCPVLWCTALKELRSGAHSNENSTQCLNTIKENKNQ